MKGRGHGRPGAVRARAAHTCPTGLVRRATDLVTVAELAGHSRVETTRRYSLPRQADRQQAVDDLQIDY